jgi:HEAT repeat protein
MSGRQPRTPQRRIRNDELTLIRENSSITRVPRLEIVLISFHRWFQFFALGVVATLAAIGSPSYAEIRTEFVMDSSPELNVPQPVQNFSPALKSLWLAALDRPEADMQRMAAETIARAHKFGVPELSEAVPRLVALLLASNSHPATRFAAARALIELDSRDSSDKLFDASQKYEADLRQLVEPALAKWNFSPAISAWKQRLENPQARFRDLILAIRGLAQNRDASATNTLLEIAHDETRSIDLRLEAATAAGQCATAGLESDAARLAHRNGRQQSVYSLCACRLLARHDSDEAKTLLTELTEHQDSVVAASALNQLLEIDSTLVLPLAKRAINHPDPRVRRAGAAAYLQHPTAERITFVSHLLADPHPDVRREVCEKLFHLSDQSVIAEVIRTIVVEQMAQDTWQGQEQAALLAGMLELKPAAGRLVELLESPRAEVGIASAWALRKVAVPETSAAIIDKFKRQSVRRTQVSDPKIDEQVAHLCEALGVLKADDAVPDLVRYIPKNPLMGESSRCAAIWALGQIKEGKRDEALENAFNNRIRDFSDVDPELDSVKEKSAIALARMKAVDLAPEIRSIAEAYKFGPRLSVALRWAVKELTGEEMPAADPQYLPTGSWFLEPYSK